MAIQNQSQRRQEDMHSEINELRNKADELREKGSDLLRDTIDEFKDRSDDVRAIVKEYVHQKPFKSLGFAVLAGAALALLLRR